MSFKNDTSANRKKSTHVSSPSRDLSDTVDLSDTLQFPTSRSKNHSQDRGRVTSPMKDIEIEYDRRADLVCPKDSFSEKVKQFYATINSTSETVETENPKELATYVLSDIPYVTLSMVLIIFLSFTVGLAFIPQWREEQDVISPSTEKAWMQRVGHWPGCDDLRAQVWRLFSYSLVHSGFVHLLSNLTMLVSYGSILEGRLEGRRHVVAAVFLVGSVVGALGQSYQSPYKGVVGASSGCYSMFGFLSGLHLTKVAAAEEEGECGGGLRGESHYDFFISIVLFSHIFCDLILFTIYYDDDVAYFSHFFGWTSGLLLAMTLLASSKTISRLALAIFVAQAYILSYSYSYFPPFSVELDDCCAQAFWMIEGSPSSLTDVSDSYVCIDDTLYDRASSHAASYLSSPRSTYNSFAAQPKKA